MPKPLINFHPNKMSEVFYFLMLALTLMGFGISTLLYMVFGSKIPMIYSGSIENFEITVVIFLGPVTFIF